MVGGAAEVGIGDGSSSPGFELERIFAQDGRVRISGWWHGVRGRRFIRPSLSAVGGRSRARALADLEHKPWSPEGAQPWLAEFVWQDSLDDVEAFELAVAPDLAVRIPTPSRSRRARKPDTAPAITEIVGQPRETTAQTVEPKRVAKSPGRQARRIAASVPLELRLTRLEEERDRALASRDRAVAERDELARKLEQSVAEGERLLEEREAATERAARGAADLDRVVAESRSLRDEAERAAQAREDALRSQQRAELERDALEDQRRKLLAERGELIKARDQARAERNGLLEQHSKRQTEREHLIRERNRALELRDAVAAERDRLRAQRAEAVAERDELERTRQELERTRQERDRYRRERDEAVAAGASSAATLERLHQERDRYRRERDEAAAKRDMSLDELERVRRQRDVAVVAPPPAVNAESRRASHAAPDLQRQRTPQQAEAAPPSPFPRLLARATAILGLIAIVLIMVLIVLSH